MTKPQLKLLEKAFVAEYSNALPAQLGRSKQVHWLEKEGYLQPMETVLGGPFPVRVRGHQLTHLGRFTYCASC